MGTGAWEGEQQSVNKLRQQLTKSVGFLWRRPKHVALNIRHAAHTKGTLPDPARTDGWRTQGREPRAVTGASAMIRLSYFAEMELAMLMLLVPFQQGYAGASGGCDSAQAELQQCPQPCTTALVPLPACLACPGQALGAGSSLGPAARTGKGGAVARKTSMHKRVVSAPWELGFCECLDSLSAFAVNCIGIQPGSEVTPALSSGSGNKRKVRVVTGIQLPRTHAQIETKACVKLYRLHMSSL